MIRTTQLPTPWMILVTIALCALGIGVYSMAGLDAGTSLRTVDEAIAAVAAICLVVTWD